MEFTLNHFKVGYEINLTRENAIEKTGIVSDYQSKPIK